MDFVLFLYSPHSGDNRILNYLDQIIKKYQNKGFSIIPFRLTDTVSIDDIFKDLDIKPNHILIAGGDGTVNMVVNSMMKCGVNYPIATLPAGTANDFAHVMGYPASILKTCDMILSGHVQRVDLGMVNDQYFVNVLSAGLLTDVSQRTPTRWKNNFGKMAYYMSSLQELPRFQKIAIRMESENVTFDDKVLMFLVFNGRTAGNFNLAYYSDVADGLFDVLVIKGNNLAETIETALHFASRVESSYPKGVLYFKANSIKITGEDNIKLDIDGEQGPNLPVEIKCIQGGLKVIVPVK